MRSGRTRQLGYTVSGGPRGSSSFDDLTLENDVRCAKIMDALISDLPNKQQLAIHNAYLNAVWRFKEDPIVLLEEAEKTLQIGMNQRGIV